MTQVTAKTNKIVLSTAGTWGDVLPFIGLGRALCARGRHVELVANANFAHAARAQGVPFVPLGSARDYQRAVRNPRLWHPRHGLKHLIDLLLPDPLMAFERLMERVELAHTTLVAHPLSFAARLVQEKHAVACISLVLSPCWFRSRYRVPVMVGAQDMSAMARPLKSLMWRLADWLHVDPAVTPGLNKARRALGLRPIRRPFDRWIYSPQLTLGLFPDWFAPAQPDWPTQLRLTGFAPSKSFVPVPEPVEAFLAAGSAPVVFAPGTGVADTDAFFETAQQACRRIGRRGLLLSMQNKQPPPTHDTDQFLHAPFAPLDAILARCAALVHHGGIGTTAQALAAGIPQVVRPLTYDQPDNAACVQRLGIGTRILPKHFTPSTLALALDHLLTDPTTAQRNLALASTIDPTQTLETICALLDDEKSGQQG
ncbi:MAG: glycosyltransferase family 1 protein [Bradymonadaceae bacterium]|nr:glycosyltransferase family 1 protein [Lujinxingiaceae bacterium]